MRRVIFIVFWININYFSLHAQEKLTLKIGTLAPKSSTWGKFVQNIRREIYVNTKNSSQIVLIRAYYGGVQGDETEIGKKIRYGQLDGGFFAGNGLGVVCREARVLDLPLQFSSYEQIDFVYANLKKDLDVYFQKQGFFLAGIGNIGYAYFFSQKKIGSFEDIRHSKMWLWKGDRLVQVAMKVLQIPAIAISFNDVNTALQTGLIQGVYCTPSSLIALQWHKQIKYMLDMPLAAVSSGLVFSLKSWQKITPKNQSIILEVVSKRMKEMTIESRKNDEIALTTLQQQRVTLLKSQDKKSTVLDYAKQIKKKMTGSFIPKTLIEKIDRLIKDNLNSP